MKRARFAGVRHETFEQQELVRRLRDARILFCAVPNGARVKPWIANQLKAKLGVPPHRVLDLLALMGDSSDDIPGCEGWGRVRAVNAIRQTLSSKELFRRAAEGSLTKIDAKLQAGLAAQRAAFDLSHRLASLRYDVPVPGDLSAYAIQPQQAVSAA